LDPTDFFAPYRDSTGAHIVEITKRLGLLLLVLWVMTTVQSGNQEFDVVVFYLILALPFFILSVADYLLWLRGGKTSGVNIITTLSYGTPWAYFWGGILGTATIVLISAGLAGHLSFFSATLAFNTVYWLLFLVVVAPLVEEGFRNVLHPTITALVRWKYNTSYLVAGTVAMITVGVFFMLFHWVTYYQKAGNSLPVLIVLLAAAFIYSCIFTIGNYVLRTDAFGEFAHMTHNFIGYWVAITNPFDVLEWWQLGIVVGILMILWLYYIIMIIVRLRRGGLAELLPETVLST